LSVYIVDSTIPGLSTGNSLAGPEAGIKVPWDTLAGGMGGREILLLPRAAEIWLIMVSGQLVTAVLLQPARLS
jgi:hypothetical protein